MPRYRKMWISPVMSVCIMLMERCTARAPEDVDALKVNVVLVAQDAFAKRPKIMWWILTNHTNIVIIRKQSFADTSPEKCQPIPFWLYIDMY
jgi:hypothetical protein